MTSTAAPTISHADVPAVPTVAEQADRLRELDGELVAWHAMTVRIVELVAEVVGTGIVETVEGLPLDHWLRLRARMIHADAASLVTAADVLPSLPVTWSLFQRGAISWGTARNLATKLAARSFAERMLIDERIGATQRDWGQDLDGWSGNRLLDEVDRAIWELRDLQHLHLQEDREPTVNWLALQPSLDGRLRGQFDYDAVTGATIANAITAATPDGPTSTRAERRAAGLQTIAETYLAGGDGTGEAKPLVTVVVQLADITETAAGHLTLGVPGVLPTLSARLVDLLADTADLQAVIVDGARPLATTRKRHAADIPDDVRLAIKARDVADRMPGSDLTLDHIHHMVHREDDGDHDPSNLVGLSDRSHGQIHRNGWTARLDQTTGAFTITRDGTTWSAVPRTTPLSRP